jgi:acyl transferase domain-containing protein
VNGQGHYSELQFICLQSHIWKLLTFVVAAGFLSPDGRCHSFDQRANGYGRGEGVGCVILKPIDEALKNGDVIRAVIRNTGINHDGKTPGVTFPSAKAQEALARTVYAQAGLDPLETTYIESHGTGTQAGDPVEASALFMNFGKNRSDPIQVGTVKSNVGHLVSLTLF